MKKLLSWRPVEGTECPQPGPLPPVSVPAGSRSRTGDNCDDGYGVNDYDDDDDNCDDVDGDYEDDDNKGKHLVKTGTVTACSTDECGAPS